MKPPRNHTKWVQKILVLVLACSLIISCGGGVSDLASSGGVGGTGINGGGTGGTGISAGSVTDIGSRIFAEEVLNEFIWNTDRTRS